MQQIIIIHYYYYQPKKLEKAFNDPQPAGSSHAIAN